MKLVVISHPCSLAEECSILNSLFGNGMLHFHLRKPESTLAEMEKILDGIEPRFYSRVSIHQHHQLAPVYGLKRLHFTEKARHHTDLLKFLSLREEGFRLSTSIHEADCLGSMGHFDSVFYGPVFNSLSKPGYNSSLGPSFIFDKKGLATEVIALGGISPVNLEQVREMNFDGAAVLGSIWNDPEFALESFALLKNLMPKN